MSNPRVKTPPQTQGKASGLAELETGKVYDATVSSVSVTDNTVNVTLKNAGIEVDSCVVGSAIFSSLLGFKTNFLPPVNTKVKLVYGDPPVVIACLPSDPADGKSSESHTVTGLAGKVNDLKTFQERAKTPRKGHTRPQDLLEGEFDISNQLGVALSMMTTFARLSAGDRAGISVHLLNDMVRVISQTFRHFSAFGDMQIFNDGRLNVRWDGSSYEHETLGREKADDPRVEVTGNTVDLQALDSISETGRWRFSHFVGFLGDFVNMFVTDPVSGLGRLAQDAFRSGKARVHIGGDGTILVQSVGEIAFERVVRVVVPVETKRHEDPQGTLKKDYDQLQSNFLKFWNYGADLKDISHTAYQLREYARWLNSFHSLARFHQTEAKGGDWTVPSETQLDEPEWTAHEKDKEEANPSLTPRFKDVYATVRIMRDGSIVAMEAGGGAISMVGGSAQIAVPKHLWFEAAGDIHFRAGQNIFMVARRSIELVAIAGGLTLKARSWLRFLCEWGSVYIKSDAEDPAAPGYTPKTNDDLTWGDQDPLPDVLEHAVLIEATKGRVAAMGKTRATLSSSGIPEDDDDETGTASVISMRNKASLISQRKDVEVLAPNGNFQVKIGKDFLLVANRVLWKLQAFLFDINQVFTVRWSGVHVQRVVAEMISGLRSILGPKMPGPDEHENHISAIPEDNTEPYEPQYAEDEDLENLTALKDRTDEQAAEFAEAHPTWDFEPKTIKTEEDPIFQSLAQQRIVKDTDLTTLYGSWNWSSNALKNSGGTYNGRETPALNRNDKQLEHSGGDDLHKPTSKKGIALATQTPLRSKNIITKFLKI